MPSAREPSAKRQMKQLISRESLEKRLELEKVNFRSSARLPALLELANKHGLLAMDWPQEPQTSLLDLPTELIELILTKTLDGWRWHRQADALFSMARCCSLSASASALRAAAESEAGGGAVSGLKPSSCHAAIRKGLLCRQQFPCRWLQVFSSASRQALALLPA